MNVLDLTIANVSIPTIAGDLGASTAQGTWIITFFAVANAIMVPLTGWLSDRVGQVRLFVLSTLAFTLTSVLCGLAGSLDMLILGRILQGAAAGPMVPLSQSLLLRIYPPDKAARAMVAWTLPALLGPVLGPMLGGYLTETLSWPWIFFINVPVGVLGAWVIWVLMRDRESLIRRVPVDRIGLVLLVVWVAALQLMLDLGREQDWFSSTEITALAVIAAAGFCLFVAWEIYEPHPVVDLTLFSYGNFRFGVIVVSFGFGVYFSGVVLLSLWMQQTLGFSATMAGVLGAPPGLMGAVMAPLVLRLMAKVDIQSLLITGFAAFAAGNLMRTGFVPDSTPGAILVAQFTVGFGVSLIMLPTNVLIISGLPQQRVAQASGLSNFIRLLATAAMTSAATTLWDYRASTHHSRLVEEITLFGRASMPYIDQAGTFGLTLEQALGLVERQIDVQAHTMAMIDYFWLCGLLFIAMLLPLCFSWLRLQQKK